MKTCTVKTISSDQRIRDYEKDPTPSNAHRCIKAHKEAIIEFCKRFEEINDTKEEY